ncbi:helicase-exonuclease AddAB subunit AddA [Alicyclobacillus sp. SP_1]|uniref:helicase-exonuclease AddAB subunit AddA n=1 Tax=Alicyclobacillus sp. SP_1 TaxID=2942475 RepID=UPI0021586295|nr:helicase-exonuclease AddAB subunit AddA [Alicyclobacillus sp. SP_1]
MRSYRPTHYSETQRMAMDTCGMDVLVSAGAGSGKTSVLVERVVTCLFREIPVDIDRMLIVTFTEAAAAEMRERILTRLTEVRSMAWAASDEEALRRVDRVFSLFDRAQISTLHAFCMDVVRRHFLFLGLNPDLRLMDDAEQSAMRRHVAAQTVAAAFDDDQTALMLVADALHVRSEDIGDLLLRLDEFAGSQPNPTAWLQSAASTFGAADRLSSEPWYADFLHFIEDRVSFVRQLFDEALHLAAQNSLLDPYHRSLAQGCTLLEDVFTALSEGNLPKMVAAIHRVVAEKGRPVVRGEVEGKAEVQRLRTEAYHELTDLNLILSRGELALHADVLELRRPVQTVLNLVQSFRDSFQDMKKSRSLLDFSDLEHFAHRVLSDASTGEAERLRARFEEIFVDEYQDTSPIQATLLNSFRRPQGNLFLVGDVKQSIYRFRMAEPTLFLNAYETLGVTRPGTVIPLSDNYRSRREVVDCINWLFEYLFQYETVGYVYDERAKMNVSAPYQTGQGSVQLHLLDGRMEEVDAVDPPLIETYEDMTSFEREANWLADRVFEALGHGEQPPLQVWDKAIKSMRDAKPSDIVILLRSMQGKADVVLEALRARGIAAEAKTSGGFYQSLEIRWCFSLMGVLSNPRRDLDFVTLMRSPLGGFTDVQIATLRTFAKGPFIEVLRKVVRSAVRSDKLSEDGASLHPSLGNPDALRSFATFLERLERWRVMARERTAGETLRQIFAEMQYLDYVTAMPGGTLRRANVRRLLERADALDSSDKGGLVAFLLTEEALMESATLIGEARDVGDENAPVRVMSVHASKGLEFPIVYLPDLGRAFRREGSKQNILIHRELGMGPNFSNPQHNQRWRTAIALAIATREDADALAEEARILYVAMTRAKEHLIMSGSSRDWQRIAARQLAGTSVSGGMTGTLFRSSRSMMDWLLRALSSTKEGFAWLERVADGCSEGQVAVRAMDVSLWLMKDIANAVPARDMAADSSDAKAEWVVSDIPQFLERMSQRIEDSQGRNQLSLEIFRPLSRPSIPAKVSATELRRLWVAAKTPGTAVKNAEDAKEFQPSQRATERLLTIPAFVDSGQMAGKQRGSVMHRIFQHLPLSVEPTQDSVTDALWQLCEAGQVRRDDLSKVDTELLIGWLTSDLASRVRSARRIWREQPFFSRLMVPHDAVQSDRTDVRMDNHSRFVTLQGVIDVLAEEERGFLVVDFKTDAVYNSDVKKLTQEYEAQIAAYRQVVESLAPGRPVSAFLYFVEVGQAVEVGRVPLELLFQPGG